MRGFSSCRSRACTGLFGFSEFFFQRAIAAIVFEIVEGLHGLVVRRRLDGPRQPNITLASQRHFEATAVRCLIVIASDEGLPALVFPEFVQHFISR